MEYAGILWGVDGNYWYLYVDEDRQMTLAPMADVTVAEWTSNEP